MLRAMRRPRNHDIAAAPDHSRLRCDKNDASIIPPLSSTPAHQAQQKMTAIPQYHDTRLADGRRRVLPGSDRRLGCDEMAGKRGTGTIAGSTVTESQNRATRLTIPFHLPSSGCSRSATSTCDHLHRAAVHRFNVTWSRVLLDC